MFYFRGISNLIDKVLETKFFTDDSFMSAIIVSLYLISVALIIVLV